MADWVERQRGLDWIEYRLGDERAFVEVRSSMGSFGEKDVWDISLHVCGSSTIQEIVGLEKAKRIGEFLYEELLPEHRAARVRSDARTAAWERERAEKDEAERPAREKEERERAKRLAEIEPEEVSKCPECGHIDDLSEFEETGYECSRCSSTGRGPDGRRCDQCHIFRARVADHSCPLCEVPLDEVETALAKRDGGTLVEMESA